VLRRAAPLVLLIGLVAGCGGGDAEPRAAGPLSEDAFAGEAEAIGGGTVDVSSFADQDLVVWFWSPW
jgi:hypothetical protein